MAKRKRHFCDNPKEMALRYKLAEKQVMLDTMMNYVGDCALLVLNSEFGFGEERLVRFNEALNKETQRWWEVTAAPKPGDKTSEIGYVRSKFDEALKRVCGSHFVPFEQRYEWIDNNVI